MYTQGLILIHAQRSVYILFAALALLSILTMLKVRIKKCLYTWNLTSIVKSCIETCQMHFMQITKQGVSDKTDWVTKRHHKVRTEWQNDIIKSNSSTKSINETKLQQKFRLGPVHITAVGGLKLVLLAPALALTITEPQHHKVYRRTCAPSEDLDQTAHSRSLI